MQTTEEKLALAQEELISNRNQISNHNQLIKELKTARSTLEHDVSKKDQQLKEQEKLLQEIQKDKVNDFHLTSFSFYCFDREFWVTPCAIFFPAF